MSQKVFILSDVEMSMLMVHYAASLILWNKVKLSGSANDIFNNNYEVMDGIFESSKTTFNYKINRGEIDEAIMICQRKLK
jgi:hypothetical protein